MIFSREGLIKVLVKSISFSSSIVFVFLTSSINKPLVLLDSNFFFLELYAIPFIIRKTGKFGCFQLRILQINELDDKKIMDLPETPWPLLCLEDLIWLKTSFNVKSIKLFKFSWIFPMNGKLSNSNNDGNTNSKFKLISTLNTSKSKSNGK